MSTHPISHEEAVRQSERACHILTGNYPSATTVSFDDSDGESSVVDEDDNLKKWHELMEIIFGSDESFKSVDYFQASKDALEYNESHGTEEMKIDLIRKTQHFRAGEDYGAGDSCNNTDCYRDFTPIYFKQFHGETLCPDCCLLCSDEVEPKHEDKRNKTANNVL